MESNRHFLSCDWGTSNFRMRLVDRTTLEVLVEHKTDQGVKRTHDKFLRQKKLNRQEFFAQYLYQEACKVFDERPLPILVIAGMASSNIGVKELPYGSMPFAIDGAGMVWEELALGNEFQALLISGMQDKTGVMRGEETQALGLVEYLKSYSEGILILPGTHSKHLTYSGKNFESFKSFMTGELFQLLSEESILTNNVEKCQWIDKRVNAFKEGLAMGFTKGFSGNLFSIRARQLIENSNKKDNYFRLSGMLIGDELACLKTYGGTVFLAASEPFFSMYQLGMNFLLKKAEIVSFSDRVLEKALLSGQVKILEQHGK